MRKIVMFFVLVFVLFVIEIEFEKKLFFLPLPKTEEIIGICQGEGRLTIVKEKANAAALRSYGREFWTGLSKEDVFLEVSDEFSQIWVDLKENRFILLESLPLGGGECPYLFWKIYRAFDQELKKMKGFLLFLEFTREGNDLKVILITQMPSPFTPPADSPTKEERKDKQKKNKDDFINQSASAQISDQPRLFL